MIYQMCDFMMSISAWDIFEYIFWTITNLPAKLGQLIDVNKGNIFWNLLSNLEDWG